MKRKNVIVTISAIILLLSLASSCTVSSPSQSSAQSTQTQSSEAAKIAELEEKILQLIQTQQLSDKERQKEIDALEAEIERLKGQSSTSKEPESTTPPLSQIFKYKVENGKAIINEIDTDEVNITIPAVIDGYQVISVGTQALRSSTVKSIIVSSGIEKLDWFAFSGCTSLSSVSIPDSVISIGYGAFDNASKSLTLYCSRESFAHKYAQSYGITYGIT